MPAKISAWEAQLNNSAANNFSRWRVLGQPTFLVAGLGKTYHPTYAGEVGYLRDWIKARVTMLTKEAAAEIVGRDEGVARGGGSGGGGIHVEGLRDGLAGRGAYARGVL